MYVIDVISRLLKSISLPFFSFILFFFLFFFWKSLLCDREMMRTHMEANCAEAKKWWANMCSSTNKPNYRTREWRKKRKFSHDRFSVRFFLFIRWCHFRQRYKRSKWWRRMYILIHVYCENERMVTHNIRG